MIQLCLHNTGECTRTSIATSNEKRLQITKIHKQPKRRRRKERSKTTRRNKKKEAEAKAKAKAKAKNKYESERAESPCVAKGVQINRKIKTRYNNYAYHHACILHIAMHAFSMHDRTMANYAKLLQCNSNNLEHVLYFNNT